MKIILIYLVVVVLFNLSACGGSSNDRSNAAQGIDDIQWELISYGYETSAKSTLIEGTRYTFYLNSSDNSVRSEFDCNFVNMDYSIAQNQITMENYTTTLVACTGHVLDGYAEQNEFIRYVLADSPTYERTGVLLTLTAADSSQLILTNVSAD